MLLFDLMGLDLCFAYFSLERVKFGILIYSFRIGLLVVLIFGACIIQAYKFINNSISD